jgi:TolB protein
MDINSAQELRLSDTTNDEYPSFSPNGRYIMYATASTARGSLAIVSTDGRVKTKISIQAGDIRQPTWGPFMK